MFHNGPPQALLLKTQLLWLLLGCKSPASTPGVFGEKTSGFGAPGCSGCTRHRVTRGWSWCHTQHTRTHCQSRTAGPRVLLKAQQWGCCWVRASSSCTAPLWLRVSIFSTLLMVEGAGGQAGASRDVEMVVVVFCCGCYPEVCGPPGVMVLLPSSLNWGAEALQSPQEKGSQRGLELPNTQELLGTHRSQGLE